MTNGRIVLFQKKQRGKAPKKFVFMTSFWNDVRYALKLTAPLVRVLRLVDNEKKPSMGYISEAMDRAKDAIAASFGGETNVDKYNEAFKYIDERWEVQLHRPLHAAGYYLNPAFYYDNKDRIQSDEEVQKGLYDVIVKLVDTQLHDVILKELSSYKNASGLFGIQLAKDSRKTKPPADWWECFGASAPNLQRLAIRILSLTCSSSGCERNWSAFEQAESLTGIQNPILAGQELIRKGVRTKWVIIKVGSKGSILITESSISCAPAFKVNVVDTVGCGDSYTAAVAFGYLHNMPPVNTLALANAVGAATATGIGAGRNVATLDKVLELLKKSNLREDDEFWTELLNENVKVEDVLLLSGTLINGHGDRFVRIPVQTVVAQLLPKFDVSARCERSVLKS